MCIAFTLQDVWVYQLAQPTGLTYSLMHEARHETDSWSTKLQLEHRSVKV